MRDENDQIEDKTNIVFTFPKVDGFDDAWREYCSRKMTRKGDKKGED